MNFRLSKYIFAIFLAIANFPIYAQMHVGQGWTTYSGITPASLCIALDFRSNVCLSRTSDSLTASLEYTPSRFGLSDLSAAALQIAIPASNELTIVTSLANEGGELHRTLGFATGAAYSVNKSFSAAVTLEYQRIDVLRFGYSDALSGSVSALLDIDDKTWVAAMFSNVNRATPFAQESGLAYQFFAMAIGSRLGEIFSGELGIVSSIQSQTAVSATLVSRIHSDIVVARYSMRTAPRAAQLDIVLKPYWSTALLFSAQYHDILGFSPRLGIAWSP